MLITVSARGDAASPSGSQLQRYSDLPLVAFALLRALTFEVAACRPLINCL